MARDGRKIQTDVKTRETAGHLSLGREGGKKVDGLNDLHLSRRNENSYFTSSGHATLRRRIRARALPVFPPDLPVIATEQLCSPLASNFLVHEPIDDHDPNYRLYTAIFHQLANNLQSLSIDSQIDRELYTFDSNRPPLVDRP